MPKVRINETAQWARHARNSSDSQFISFYLQAAQMAYQEPGAVTKPCLRLLTTSHNNRTLYGEEAMKPLVLNDVAEEVRWHESTMRVRLQKYMHTPRGIFELKYFFSSHVNTDSGGECSSTAIRALIKLVAAETRQTFEHSKIAEVMEQGIMVARRTIAKALANRCLFHHQVNAKRLL